MNLKIGDRVLIRNDSLGIIEEIDDMFATVRYLTPNNELSCCSGICFTKNLTKVGDHVVPMQRNKEWWEESKRLYDLICSALEDTP